MRVTDVNTDKGVRLAIGLDDGWTLIDADDAPRSVDDLVRGGNEARRSVERAAAHARQTLDLSPGLCVPIPGKIICIGVNYRRHALETGSAIPTSPVVFGKFTNALVSSGQVVRLPSTAEQYDYEAELGVVIGRRAVAVSEEHALDYVWGYCNCNDISARELQARSTQFTLGKTLDGFLPVGPMLVSSDEVGDPQNLTIQAWLNGELRQDSNTADMVFSVGEVISYVSHYIPLDPGDFIATGTPEGVILGRDPKIWMRAGDVVDVAIQGLGRLTTPLATASW
jgi:2-keto-4-pentenoate hydratase/2-oxohepta-3-ene-1,7-dioic acid hydratase in catechol pathway